MNGRNYQNKPYICIMRCSNSYNPATQHTPPKFAPMFPLSEFEMEQLVSKANSSIFELIGDRDTKTLLCSTFTGMTLTQREAFPDHGMRQNKKAMRFYIDGHAVEIDVFSEPFYPKK